MSKISANCESGICAEIVSDLENSSNRVQVGESSLNQVEPSGKTGYLINESSKNLREIHTKDTVQG